jgi:hypothetical protein
MKNSYEAPAVSIISGIGSFVLGQKPWALCELDAVLGWGWGFFPWNDLDEGE